jgi:hypothetical protein
MRRVFRSHSGVFGGELPATPNPASPQNPSTGASKTKS